MNSIDTILEKAISVLSIVPGVQAVVLGGSRARGTHSASSDIDLGIYYDEQMLDIQAFSKAARSLDDEKRDNLVSPPGDWGNWVNGGAWLIIDDLHVDLILREVNRVRQMVKEGCNGIVSAHYQPGHPHAYLNIMYMGELAICKVLWSKEKSFIEMKQVAENYPLELQHALINKFWAESNFTLSLLEKNLQNDDVYYLTALFVRSISSLNQVLFALNKEYCLNEKRAVKMIDHFALHPENYKNKVDYIFILTGENAVAAFKQLDSLIYEVGLLLNDR